MITEGLIRTLVEEKLRGTEMFIVGLNISTSNRIVIEMDGLNGVTIDDCVSISRHIESNLDRDSEDYELQVSSAGLDRPLSDRRQFTKNIGRDVKVVLSDGSEVKGELTAVGEKLKIKLPASKRKKLPEREEAIDWGHIRETKVVISFK